MFQMFNQLFTALTSLFRACNNVALAAEHLSEAGKTQAAVFNQKTQITCEMELLDVSTKLEEIRAAKAKEVKVIAATTKPAPAKRGPKPRKAK